MPRDKDKTDPIAVTSDGSTLWLECFAENLSAGRGLPVIELTPGTSWGALAGAVQDHQDRYKCAPPPGAAPAATVTTDGGDPE